MISSEFKKDDYWLIKWPLLCLALSIVVCGGVLVALNSIDTTATREVRRARSDLDEARQSVDKIEEEEATIIEYIGRYQQMDQEGVVAAEDRLEFQETLAEVRDRFNLFPVNLNFGGQTALPLQFPQGGQTPGREVILHTSQVELSLPLLHENDLGNLLVSLVEGPGLLQPLSCTLSANSNRTSFIYLAQHFDATCLLNWYTFQLPPPVENAAQ